MVFANDFIARFRMNFNGWLFAKRFTTLWMSCKKTRMIGFTNTIIIELISVNIVMAKSPVIKLAELIVCSKIFMKKDNFNSGTQIIRMHSKNDLHACGFRLHQ